MAAFANATATSTTVTFSAAGAYVLRLTANDGTHVRFDELTITVADPVLVGAGDIAPNCLAGGQPDCRHRHARAARHPARHGLHAGRQRLCGRHRRRVRQLLRPDLGTASAAHPAGQRQSRLQHAGRQRLLRLLQRPGRAGRAGRRPHGGRLLQLRPRELARRGPEQRVHVALARQRLRRGLGAGAVAARRSGREPHQQHHRDVAPPVLQFERWPCEPAAALPGALRLRRRHSARWPLAQLRAAGTGQSGGCRRRGVRHPLVRHWHRRDSAERVRHDACAERGAQQHDARRDEVHAPRRELRLAVHPDRRPDVHRCRNDGGARAAVGQRGSDGGCRTGAGRRRRRRHAGRGGDRRRAGRGPDHHLEQGERTGHRGLRRSVDAGDLGRIHGRWHLRAAAHRQRRPVRPQRHGDRDRDGRFRQPAAGRRRRDRIRRPRCRPAPRSWGR